MTSPTPTPSATPTVAPRERLTIEQFHERLKAQGVPVNDYAFRCVMCNTVQSMRSLVEIAKCDPDQVERVIGYSCFGRFTNAGAWDPKKAKRRAVPGCDWTCGGLFGAAGRGVIVVQDGVDHARFYIATPEEAAELARRAGQPFRPEPAAPAARPGGAR